MASLYRINKGVNKAIEFRGIKAQYIGWLGGGLVVLLIAFAILYITGVNAFLCLSATGAGGVYLFSKIYKLSNKYGQFGFMKMAASKRIPGRVVIKSRKSFVKLKK